MRLIGNIVYMRGIKKKFVPTREMPLKLLFKYNPTMNPKTKPTPDQIPRIIFHVRFIYLVPLLLHCHQNKQSTQRTLHSKNAHIFSS